MAFSLLNQTAAVIKVNLLSIPRRLLMSVSASLSIALVVTILLGSLALQHGLGKALEGSGSDDVAVVLSPGATSEINSNVSAEQQQLLATAPGVAVEGDRPALSAELVVIVDAIQRASGVDANLAFRGVGAAGSAARRDIEIVQGRMFVPGTDEIIVGRGVAEAFEGFAVGETPRIGNNSWRVVGLFEANGSVYESELWADLPVLQALFNRGDFVQSVRLRLVNADALEQVRAFSASDPRLGLDIKSERAFLRAQSESITGLITMIGQPLAIIMAIGAFAGAVNAMYSSTADRAVEISTLRAIGFGRLSTFLGTLAESLLLALFGALAGVGVALLLFNGMTASTVSGGLTQVVFDLSLTPDLVMQGVWWALAVGAVGGAIPAWKAARRPIFSTDT